MKRYWSTILIVACLAVPLAGYVGCHRGADFQTAVAMDKVQQAFDRAKSPEDFLKVASMYDETRRNGVVSGAVLYNQGNALMRAGQRGRAIAAYREALRYRPTDPHLKANLEYALGPDGTATGRKTIIGHVLFWQDWVSYPAKFVMAASAAVVTFLLAVVALYWHRRLFARLAVVGLIVTGLFCFAAGYDWYRFDYQQHGVVVLPEVVARKGNAESYQPAFTDPLVEGTEFSVLGRRGDWLMIQLPGDGSREGWIKDNAAVVY